MEDKAQEISVGKDRTGYVGRPGSTKDLFPVYLDGKFSFEVGPRNSFGLKPGMEGRVIVTRDTSGYILGFKWAK